MVIPAGVEPHEALNDNQTYAVVWQVLQALRSHDDRFDAMVNKLELNGPDPRKMEFIAVCGKVVGHKHITTTMGYIAEIEDHGDAMADLERLQGIAGV